MNSYIDLTGKKFGKLTPMYIDKSHDSLRHQALWVCACECGNIKTVRSDNIRNGHTKSCGCIRRENGKSRNSVIPVDSFVVTSSVSAAMFSHERDILIDRIDAGEFGEEITISEFMKIVM